MDDIPESRFTEFMAGQDYLARSGFQGWVFLPAMLFGAGHKWWGDGARRPIAHEGLDFCLFNDRQGNLFRLKEGTGVTAMYAGTVVALIDDFLGKSIVIEHRSAGGPFLTVYGHTVPGDGLRPGAAVAEGEVIAALAGTRMSGATVHPHLHLSLARQRDGAPYDGLSWKELDDGRLFAMLDPLDVLDGPYLVLDGEAQPPLP